jgi:hypothetical protein
MKVYIGPYRRNNQQREIKIRIDEYDTVSLDHTLALIIEPSIEQFIENKKGYPVIDQNDVPKELRYSETDYYYQYDLFTTPTVLEKLYFERRELQWEYILNKIHKAFYELTENDFLTPGLSKEIDEGLILFGKYYRNLWI